MAKPHNSTKTDYYVYALFRENGSPFYIGKGRGHRWDIHEYEARNGKWGRKYAVIRQIQEKGLKLIKAKLHQDLCADLAVLYEIALIGAIGRHPEGPLVNLTDGGDGAKGCFGRRNSPETLAKMSATALAQGRTPSPEAKEKARMANLGRVPTQQQRDKQRAELLGRKQSAEHIAKSAKSRTGLKRTQESKNKMRDAKLGKKLAPEHVAKIAAANKGKRRTPEVKARMAALRQERNAKNDNVMRARRTS